MAGYYAFWRFEDPAFPIGVRVALVTLILLNARQNLRQYKYAGLLAATRDAADGGDRPLERLQPGR